MWICLIVTQFDIKLQFYSRKVSYSYKHVNLDLERLPFVWLCQAQQQPLDNRVQISCGSIITNKVEKNVDTEDTSSEDLSPIETIVKLLPDDFKNYNGNKSQIV